MNKLILLPILALAACTESRGVHGDWSTGAHFGPSSKVEFLARAERGEPGVFPAPSGYSVYTQQQRASTGASAASGVPRQGTASSRTGEYATSGNLTPSESRASAQGVKVSARASSTDLRTSPYRSGAISAANRATVWTDTAVNLNGEDLRLNQVEIGSTSYAVFRRGGLFGGATPLSTAMDPSMQAALPGLTGCSSVAGPFTIGPNGRSNTYMVYALNC